MNENTISWIKVITSVLFFNILIIVALAYFKLANGYTLSLKILLDITICFVTDKSIKKLSVGLKDGFSVTRE